MRASLKILSASMAVFTVACSSEGYTPYLAQPYAYGRADEEYDRFTLQRTACFGFCPVYKVIVDERDILFFQGERYVAEADGVISKRMPQGTFDRLIRIARDHGFSGYDARYPSEDGGNCGAVVTDMPSVIIAFDAKRLDHQVNWYQGCSGFEGEERFEEMVAAMDAMLDIDDWIGSREQFTGDEE